MVENEQTLEEELLMNLKKDLSEVFLKDVFEYLGQKFRPTIQNLKLKYRAWKENLLQ